MQRFGSLALATALLLAFSVHVPSIHAAPAADYAVANGHFYTQANGQGGTQANGQGGGGATGFTVTNGGDIPFWTTFQQAGGVAALGYPASRRFSDGSFTEQVFQKAVLQWNGQSVAYLNVLDVLHAAGKDGWLQATWMTPSPASTAADTGLVWDKVVARHQAYLGANRVLRAAYFAVPNPLNRYGLPVTPISDEGPALVVRCQRVVLQLWKQAEPWAAAGTVTVANAGDILKASGLVAASALQPQAAPAAASAGTFTYVALGASDAAGYGASSPSLDYVGLLGGKLDARYGQVHVVDLGIDGATTAEVATQETANLPALHPSLVTLTIGPNDILNLVPPGAFNADLDRLLTAAKAAGSPLLAVANIPDFSLTPAVPSVLRPLAHQMIVAYNAIIANQARVHGAVLVDLYVRSEQVLPGNPNLVSADGFHPNDAGYALYADTFWAALQRALP